MFIKGIEFETNESNGRGGVKTSDVSFAISKGKSNGDKFYVCLTIRNDKFNTLFPGCQGINIGVKGRRCYLMGGNGNNCFHVLANSGHVPKGTSYFRIKCKRIQTVQWMTENVGDYDLKYDQKVGMWYVDTEVIDWER